MHSNVVCVVVRRSCKGLKLVETTVLSMSTNWNGESALLLLHFSLCGAVANDVCVSSLTDKLFSLLRYRDTSAGRVVLPQVREPRKSSESGKRELLGMCVCVLGGGWGVVVLNGSREQGVN